MVCTIEALRGQLLQETRIQVLWRRLTINSLVSKPLQCIPHLEIVVQDFCAAGPCTTVMILLFALILIQTISKRKLLTSLGQR